jgi:predicted nucleic acid-binding Zn ribbon protein
MSKKCKICSKNINGRSDKTFCSIECKNYYHTNLRRATDAAVKEIDTILHRNRSILLELLGKHKSQVKTGRIVLDKKKIQLQIPHPPAGELGRQNLPLHLRLCLDGIFKR